MSECANYVRIDGDNVTLLAMQFIHFDPLAWFPIPPGEQKTPYMMKEFGCRWLTALESDEPATLQRYHTYLVCTFTTDAVPPLPFYRKMVERFPDIQLTYEYFHYRRGIVGHGHINRFNALRSLPIAYSFHNLGQLAAIRSTRLWDLNLARPGCLPPAPWEHAGAQAEDCRVIHTLVNVSAE
jgi:hypothetical protein